MITYYIAPALEFSDDSSDAVLVGKHGAIENAQEDYEADSLSWTACGRVDWLGNLHDFKGDARHLEAIAMRGKLAVFDTFQLHDGSYKPEVIADSSGVWASNALRFATYAEAKAAVEDLADRWFAVRQTRVVMSDDPVNYRWIAGVGLQRLETVLV